MTAQVPTSRPTDPIEPLVSDPSDAINSAIPDNDREPCPQRSKLVPAQACVVEASDFGGGLPKLGDAPKASLHDALNVFDVADPDT